MLAAADKLERVLQRELQVTFCGANCILLSNLSPTGAVNVSSGIPVADNVESIEGIELKSDKVFTDYPEVLDDRHVNVMKSWSAD